jgi:2'-5' RNA ligase
MNMPPPLIATLALDDAAQAWFDQLRRTYFPPERLLVGAHVTLFHALPGEREAEVAARMREIAGASTVFPVSVAGVRNLGRGAAFRLEAPAAAALRAQLAVTFADALTPQDRAKWAPHVTIQNKVTAGEVRETCEILARLTPPPVLAQGWTLWRYMQGPWEEVNTYVFAAKA